MAAKTTSETRKLSELTADPNNARRHSEGQITQIERSVARFGYVAPVIIRPNGVIIGGHATVIALTRLKHTEVECRVVNGLTEPGYAALGLALNKIAENSTWNDTVLRSVLSTIEDTDALGFSDKELAKLLAEPEELEVREIETSAVEDEFWVSIRGPLAQQAQALKALREALKPFQGVSVEQGTIGIG